MARREHSSRNNDKIAGMSVDDLTPDKLPETIFNKVGGKELLKQLLPSGGRDAGFLFNKIVNEWLVSTGAIDKGVDLLNKSGVLENIGFLPNEINSKQTAQAIKTAIDVGVSVSEAAVIALQNHRDDKNVRKTIMHEMQDYLDAGYTGLRASSSIPTLGNKNDMLEMLDKRLTKQYEQGLMQAGASALMAATQYAVIHKFDIDAQKAKVEEFKTTALNSDGGVEAKTPEQIKKINVTYDAAIASIEPRMMTAAISNSQKDFNKAKGGFKDVVYENRYLNASVGAALAGASVTAWVQKQLEDSISKAGSTVIAYDLVQQLNDYTNKTEAYPESIDLAKVSLPKEEKTRIFGDAKTVTTEAFIQKIFEQHAIDQTGEGIGQRFCEDVSIASKALADAISGRTYDLTTGSTMHPMALINIIGEGRIVSADAREVKGLSEVNAIIDEMRGTLPIDNHVDAEKFISKMDMPASHFKRRFESYPTDLQDTLSVLIPDSVLREKIGKSDEQIATMRSNAGEDAHEKITVMVKELAEKDNETLKKYGMSANDIKVVIDLAHDISFGEQDALHHALRPNAASDLQYALLKAEGYLHDIANKRSTADKDEAQPDDAHKVDANQAEAKKDDTDKAESKNAITPFERPSSTVASKDSTHEKLESKEKATAR
jgi:hypothetical protein